MAERLLYTARDAFALSAKDALVFHGAVAFHRMFGTWNYPIEASGDFETMTLRDKIYWLYKCQYPVVHAVKGSQLEAYFRDQGRFSWSLPHGFEVETELRLAAAGDLMSHPYLANSSGVLYAALGDVLFGADICTANLECVVVPDFKAFTIRPTEAPPLVYRPGEFGAVTGTAARRYTFLSTASNHSLDCGEAGVVSTRRALRESGIPFHGVNETPEEAEAGTIVECRGVRIGMLSHTFGLNGKRPPAGKPWLVNRTALNGRAGEVDLSQLSRQVQWCRARDVDLIVGHLHWGLEHEYYPRPEQRRMAHALAELGLDVVIGHHPHLLQPTEYYRTVRDPDRVVPIFYSLGNLVNPFTHPAFRLGGIAQVSIAKGRDARGLTKTYVRQARCDASFQNVDRQLEQVRLVPAQNLLPGATYLPPHLNC